MSTPRLAVLVVAALAAGLAAPALAGPIGPDQVPSSLQEYAEMRARGNDQLAHPEFRARTAPVEAAGVAAAGQDGGRLLHVDPYRDSWSRGVTVNFPLRTRYGAKLAGTLYAPTATGTRRLPTVVYVAGGYTSDRAAQGVGQSLAEAGYVVWTITAHDSSGNPAAPPDPDPSTEANELCEPGAWQRPQELGIRETGICAGQLPPNPDPVADPVAFAGLFAATPGYYTDDPLPRFPGIAAFYEQARAARVLPTFDAVDQLLSPANPLRSRIDERRLGLVGYSLGAHAALVVGNADPRFDAVVSHDGFGRIARTTSPRVPTLFLHHDLRNDGPRLHEPDLTQMPGALDARRFAAAGVPTGFVVPAASRHNSFVQVNYLASWVIFSTLGLFPDAAVVVDSPRDSERLAIHYTRVWLDRFVSASNGRDRKAADVALTASTFDAVTDASSIGQGTWDPLRGNVPYTLAGETTAQHLSTRSPSWLSLPGRSCPNLRKGC